MKMKWIRLGAWLLVGVLTAPVLAEASAEPPPLNQQTILADLGSETYARREAMTRRLLQDEQLSEQALLELFTAARSLEQRHRLLAVARHHAVRHTRQATFDSEGGLGAIGISHRVVQPEHVPQVDRPVIEVVSTLPGFPGHAHLQVGDLILEVDRQPLASDPNASATADHFRDLVKARPSGARMHLKIRRDEQVFEVEFSLASLQALQSMYSSTGLALRPQFREQWQKLHEQMLSRVPAPQPLSLPEATARR